MNKQIFPLLIAQFLSAFADNAILFTVIAIVLQSAHLATWYVPALQSVFLIAFVVLGPWVGGIADKHPKARVLVFANLIKATGAGLLFLDVNPLIAYGVVGVGGAIFSPAKYGILPELAGHELLVKANSWVEGSTILAIIMGMVVGAKVADYSTQLALAGIIGLFMFSILAALFLPTNIAIVKNEKTRQLSSVLHFIKQMWQLLSTPRSRFAILGGSLFWGVAAVLRVIIVVWAPLVLLLKSSSDIAELTLFLALGIIAGSALVPSLIPLEHIRRTRIPAYFMGVFIIVLSFTESLWPARGALFFVGAMGGMFVVPINALLQEQGQKTIGSGSAVSLQNFFQNLAMLLAVGTYTLAASFQVAPVLALLILGLFVLIATFLVTLHLPE